MSARLFTEEREVILEPLKAHRSRMIQDKEEFQPMTRASEIMLTAEEPSIRTYFCAKNLVMDYLSNHPNDPRAFKELGKVYLYSCVPESVDLAEKAFQRLQSLSGNIDAEGWYLWSMCYRIRLLGCGATGNKQCGTEASKKTAGQIQLRKRYLGLALKGLKLALKHSNGSNVYRFALADFYTSMNRLSKALSTLQAGISPSQRTHTDAAIFHQLGRFGISCINGLRERGRHDSAKQVGLGALDYYRRAIDIGSNSAEEWKAELATAETIVDRLVEQSSDLADFSTEPDFNPSGPTSLRRWLTGSPPPSQPVQQDHPLSSPRREDVSRSPTASPQGTTENLAEFLDRIENQAQTYENGGMDSLVENYRWLHVPSRPIIDSRGMLQPSHAGPYPTNPDSSSDWAHADPRFGPATSARTTIAAQKPAELRSLLSHDAYNNHVTATQSVFEDDELPTPSCTCSS
ncbi:hypothetical protein VP01_598g2 [Puccinia sorghi]|uniref:Uncharacterized protein n=1 Tax=Puccinia sorghi TaxID=27349 RepID=A0A0L6UIB3_9BASI|nr:hypothetical protein VP01_598g2 [Puccinia sorghi]